MSAPEPRPEQPEQPQPRDIALEQPAPGQLEELEAASEPEGPADS
ncbi:hypothetical protein [Blastococcus sp. SYSU D00695]